MAITDLFKKIVPGDDADAPVEDDEQDKKLMELFQKRNLLKRMYDKAAVDLAATKEEADALRRQAEGMGKRLNALDEMLSNAEKGQSVIVYFQLAEIWANCNSLIAMRAHELSQKHEGEERQTLLAEFGNGQRQKLSECEERLRFAQAQLDEVQTRKRELTTDLSAAQRFWHYFKRKRINADLAQIELALAPVASRHQQLSDELDKIKQTPVPDYPGLSVAAKRTVNLHLIALGQYLYRDLMANSVAQHAQNTHDTLPNATVFGDTKSCLTMVQHIAEAVTRLNNDSERQLKLSQRYAYLQEHARYAAADATLPDRECFAAIEGSVGAGSREVKSFDLDAGRILINVVDGDYFGLKDMLQQ